jgi:hypothetical protein
VRPFPRTLAHDRSLTLSSWCLGLAGTRASSGNGGGGSITAGASRQTKLVRVRTAAVTRQPCSPCLGGPLTSRYCRRCAVVLADGAAKRYEVRNVDA